MSDFVFSSYGIYGFGPSPISTTTENVFTLIESRGPGTLTDTDNDNTFESGDTVSVVYGGRTYNLEYLTSISVTPGGPSYPMFWTFNDPFSSNIDPFRVIYFDDRAQPPGFLSPSNETGGDYAFCFGVGTVIATPSGDVAVEALNIGDLISTADGRQVPVKWIGRQTVMPRFAGDRARPVRIAAGALGDGLPLRDLTVTADHGLILEGCVINASALVNGDTIRVVAAHDLPERVTYYHIETAAHDAILAEGTPAETFVDYASRQAFDNCAEYRALYGGDDDVCPEMPLPRVSSARLLPPGLKARLSRRPVA